jgi:uroporphyrinogen-III synthase
MEAILRGRGARVRRWNAYRLLRAPAPPQWENELKRSGVHFVFVGSSSQALAFVEALGRPALSRFLRRGAKLLSIGPETSRTLKEIHVPYRQAREFTFNGMIEELLRHKST